PGRRTAGRIPAGQRPRLPPAGAAAPAGHPVGRTAPAGAPAGPVGRSAPGPAPAVAVGRTAGAAAADAGRRRSRWPSLLIRPCGAPHTRGAPPHLEVIGGSGVRTADRRRSCSPGQQIGEPAYGADVRGREGAPGVEAGDGERADPVPARARRRGPVLGAGGADGALPDAAPEVPLPDGPVRARAQ